MSITTLPSMETTFTLDVKGADTGQSYQGTFTYKRPNIGAKSKIAKLATRLNEDLANLDPDMKFVHQILAELRFTIVNSPEWWQKSDFGLELFDENVIFEIYKNCVSFEREWTDKVWGKQEDKKAEIKEELKKKAKAEKSEEE
jgi:hypothetical protein